MLGNFGMDLSLVMLKAFWLESFSWILAWKCGRRFGWKFPVGSQLGHLDGLCLESVERHLAGIVGQIYDGEVEW